MRDLDGLKGKGEELGTEEGKVVMDGEDLDFSVKMVNGTHIIQLVDMRRAVFWIR